MKILTNPKIESSDLMLVFIKKLLNSKLIYNSTQKTISPDINRSSHENLKTMYNMLPPKVRNNNANIDDHIIL